MKLGTILLAALASEIQVFTLPVHWVVENPLNFLLYGRRKSYSIEPDVKYIKPESTSKETQPPSEIKSPHKRKKWPWIVDGFLLIGAAVAAAGRGGGEEHHDPRVDVDVSW